MRQFKNFKNDLRNNELFYERIWGYVKFQREKNKRF